LDLAAGNPMTVHGEVPDVRPWLERCAISVVPLRAGSGTRLKILEALSMERAVVSTRIGAEGIDVVDGEHLLLADRPEEFADRVLALMEDEALRQRLGRNGRRLVEERYDWSRVAPLLSQAYTEAARGG
jgi:glycosyltransferase involved in cell wall biosynthesis